MTAPGRLRAIDLGIALLSLTGAAIAGYLTWVAYSGSLALCTGAGGCEAVQSSQFSRLFGVPVAAIGLAGYLALLALALLGWWRAALAWLSPLLFAGSLAGLLFSLYLTWVEIAVLGAVCPWCVASQLVIAAVFALAAWRARLTLAGPPEPGRSAPATR